MFIVAVGFIAEKRTDLLQVRQTCLSFFDLWLLITILF
jgi:hypothetical protein